MNGSITAPGLATVQKFWPATTDAERLARAIVLAAIGTALLTASAKIQIPFWPVPATLQSMVVVMIGAFYGTRLGMLTLVAYMAEGLAGLPVFVGTPEKGLGIAYMAGPTGGYLIGFIAAALVTGFLVERGWGRSLVTMIAAAVLANVALYVCGLSWLASLIGWDKAIVGGLMPFLLADAVKILIAATVTVAVTRTVKA